MIQFTNQDLTPAISLNSQFKTRPPLFLWSGVFYAILVAYFVFYSRHHLVAKSPDEEFAAILSAESQLNSN